MSIVLQNADHQLHMKTVLGEVMSSLAAAGRPAEREDALPLLSLFHLESLAERHPQSLSGGQKQRLSIARALMKQADLYFGQKKRQSLHASDQKRGAGASRLKPVSLPGKLREAALTQNRFFHSTYLRN